MSNNEKKSKKKSGIVCIFDCRQFYSFSLSLSLDVNVDLHHILSQQHKIDLIDSLTVHFEFMFSSNAEKGCKGVA